MEKKNRLLIVDDDTTSLMEIIGILKNDYTISTAKNGLAAIDNIERLPPDLVLLDIIMPGLNGYDVMTKLKQSPATEDLPIILISGAIGIDDERKGLALGAIDYLRKPYDEGIVKLRVDYHIKMINKIRELSKL